MGYTNVVDYEGGKQDWIDGGNPVVGLHAHQHEHKGATKYATTDSEEDVA